VYIDLDAGLSALVDDREGEVLDVLLDRRIRELGADDTLWAWSAQLGFIECEVQRTDVEDGPVGVAGVLILRGVTNQALFVGKSDPRGCDTVSCRHC
jgi:hypothetical protein